jgi:hypothetical protein
LRYAAYGILVAGATMVYFALDSDNNQSRILRSPLHQEDLPELRLIERDVRQGGERDLFAFAKSNDAAPMPMPAISLASDPADAELRKPDLLSEVQVLGLVRRPDSANVLVKLGTSLLDIPLGKPFGEGDVLTVRSIEGINVVIEDKSSRASRTFTLSED